MAKHITLIGMMGAGKSSVAPKLAERLHRPVIEVDELIVKQEGLPISDIFLAKGEAYFRRTECEMIVKLINEPAAILSLGGGAFMWEATRQLLLKETVVFYLSATFEALCERVQPGIAARPLLNVPGVSFENTMHELLEKRGPYYSQAHYRVETDAHTPDEVARSIVTLREAYD